MCAKDITCWYKFTAPFLIFSTLFSKSTLIGIGWRGPNIQLCVCMGAKLSPHFFYQWTGLDMTLYSRDCHRTLFHTHSHTHTQSHTRTHSQEWHWEGYQPRSPWHSFIPQKKLRGPQINYLNVQRKDCTRSLNMKLSGNRLSPLGKSIGECTAHSR